MRHSIFLVICILLSSCNNTIKTNDVEQITIVPQSNKSVLSSEICDSVIIVPLETNDECLLGEISKVCCFGDSIYVCSNNSVYKYNTKGEFLSKIDHKGLGPNEYIHIDDFQILNNGNIMIFSRTDKKIFEYDWQQNCLSTVLLDFWALNFFVDNNNLFVYLGNEISDKGNDKIVLYNNGVYSKSFIEIDKNKANYLHVLDNRNLAKYNGIIYFYESFSDTIYQFTNNTFESKYVVDFNKKNIPSVFYEQNYSNIIGFYQALHNQDYAYGIHLFAETEDNLFISYLYDNQTHFSINNKNNKTTIDFVNIIETSQLCGFPIECDVENSFVSDDLLMIVIGNQLLLDYKNNLNNDEEKMQISKVLSKDIEANPIIAILRLK